MKNLPIPKILITQSILSLLFLIFGIIVYIAITIIVSAPAHILLPSQYVPSENMLDIPTCFILTGSYYYCAIYYPQYRAIKGYDKSNIEYPIDSLVILHIAAIFQLSIVSLIILSLFKNPILISFITVIFWYFFFQGKLHKLEDNKKKLSYRLFLIAILISVSYIAIDNARGNLNYLVRDNISYGNTKYYIKDNVSITTNIKKCSEASEKEQYNKICLNDPRAQFSFHMDLIRTAYKDCDNCNRIVTKSELPADLYFKKLYSFNKIEKAWIGRFFGPKTKMVILTDNYGKIYESYEFTMSDNFTDSVINK